MGECACDISAGPIRVDSSVVQCRNSQHIDIDAHCGVLTVTGSTSSDGITVTQTHDFTLRLSSVVIASPTAIDVTSGSDVSITLSGNNSVTSTDPNSAGVGCNGLSSISLRGAGRLDVTAGDSGAGIGTARNGHCRRLAFVSGAYGISAGDHGAAIGTGAADPPDAPSRPGTRRSGS
jgi:hypothetical protein